MGENRYNPKFKKKSGDFKNSNKKSFNSGFKPSNKKRFTPNDKNKSSSFEDYNKEFSTNHSKPSNKKRFKPNDKNKSRDFEDSNKGFSMNTPNKKRFEHHHDKKKSRDFEDSNKGHSTTPPNKKRFEHHHDKKKSHNFEDSNKDFSTTSPNKKRFEHHHDKQKFKPKKEKENIAQYKISNPNFSSISGRLTTKSLTPGFRVYSENLIKKGNDEFRTWDEKKSKLGAAIKKGISCWDIPQGSKILYLGIADGTTASHISDLIGENGLIYGVEFAFKPIQNLLSVIKMHKRNNIVPIYDNATLPGNYANLVSTVDIIFEDVAQKDQIDILIRNAKLFLKKKGRFMLALKARSVDSTKNPYEVYDYALDELKKHFKILDWKNLDPLEKDHCFIIGEY